VRVGRGFRRREFMVGEEFEEEVVKLRGVWLVMTVMLTSGF
jgi:hypothetical protein